MNAQEHEFARKIALALDQGTRDLDRSTVAQLAAAREQALSGMRAVPAWAPAWAGHLTSRLGDLTTGVQYLLPMAVLLLGLMGIIYWQAGNSSVSELAEIDVRLLTDDLPIDAYLDKGFDSWLKRQSR
jgi:hypothetical protein